MNHAVMELHFASCMLRGTIRYTLDSKTTPYFLLDDRFQITKLTDGAGKALPYRKEPVTRYPYRQSAYTVRSAGGDKLKSILKVSGRFAAICPSVNGATGIIIFQKTAFFFMTIICTSIRAWIIRTLRCEKTAALCCAYMHL